MCHILFEWCKKRGRPRREGEKEKVISRPSPIHSLWWRWIKRKKERERQKETEEEAK